MEELGYNENTINPFTLKQEAIELEDTDDVEDMNLKEYVEKLRLYVVAGRSLVIIVGGTADREEMFDNSQCSHNPRPALAPLSTVKYSERKSSS